jgi:1,4-alpha-glucan branching enzyme
MELNEQCLDSQTTVPEGLLVNFVYTALQAKSVSVAGTFNDWSEDAFILTKDSIGNWRGALHLKPGRYQYRYNVDGKWVNDPSARNTAPNKFGTRNTVLVVR